MYILVIIWLVGGNPTTPQIALPRIYPNKQACIAAQSTQAAYNQGVLKGSGDEKAAETLVSWCAAPVDGKTSKPIK